MQELKIETAYLREKNAFSVSPAQAAATARTNVEIPKVAWIGTSDARNEAVADSQQSSRMKLKKPTTNCERDQSHEQIIANVNLKSARTFKKKLWLPFMGPV